MKFPSVFESVCRMSPLPSQEWLKVEALATVVSVQRRTFFLEEGDSSDRAGVVLEGVFRLYRVTPNGDESVKAFRAEGEFIGAYAESLQGLPSSTFIEAVAPSRVFTIPLSGVRGLEANDAAWPQLWRRLAEHHFLLKERREQQFMTLSAEERLRQFDRENRHLLGRVPQREIAAYLGITPVALSRIRGRMRRATGAG